MKYKKIWYPDIIFPPFWSQKWFLYLLWYKPFSKYTRTRRDTSNLFGWERESCSFSSYKTCFCRHVKINMIMYQHFHRQSNQCYQLPRLPNLDGISASFRLRLYSRRLYTRQGWLWLWRFEVELNVFCDSHLITEYSRDSQLKQFSSFSPHNHLNVNWSWMARKANRSPVLWEGSFSESFFLGVSAISECEQPSGSREW